MAASYMLLPPEWKSPKYPLLGSNAVPCVGPKQRPASNTSCDSSDY